MEKKKTVILIIHLSSWQNTKSIQLFFGDYTVALPRHIWITKARYNIYIYILYIILCIYILYVHLIIKIIYISPYLWALYILISQLGGFLSHMATPKKKNILILDGFSS